MDWFSRHTNWLYTETKELSNNSIYKERYQFIDKTLISTGDILVHKEQTQYYPILIVYPEATPYVPPTIYVLNSPLDEDVAREYSKQTPDEIKKNVQTNVKYFNRRHQNEDGSICFIEMGDLHSENAEIYTIKEIIKRLRTWLSGKIPKDSREVELFHHFKNRTYEIQYLLPDLFFDTEIVKGTFYAGLSGLIPANLLPSRIAKKTYMGVMILGETEGGVVLLPKVYIKKQLILFTTIPDIKELILPEKKEAKQKAIEEEKLIEGYWWDISREPEPFTDMNILVKYIGEDDENKGIEELIKILKELLSVSKLQDTVCVGLRFPGRWREKDWQMFRLKRGSRAPIVGADNDNNELKERLLDYSVEAVYQEYFTDEYFHMRNKGRAERDALKKISISIIGCGALGSETADALNKAGVGKILLVDKDEMRAHNAVRHCLGIDKVSFPKVLGMAEHMVLHNPFVNVDMEKIKHSNILHCNIDDYLPEGNIGLSTIADDNIEAYLNEQAINEDRTVFYCRALRGGKVARIFRVIPQKDACKSCLALYSQEDGSLFIDIEEDRELPVITNECNNPVRPASAADLKVIAGIFSRIVIDHLQGINTNKNHWIWSTESLKQLKLEDSSYGLIHAMNITPHPNCPTCQKLEDIKVTLTFDAYELMKKESSESKDIETGGILIGHKASSGQYIIMRATGPGPKSTRTKTLFEKDVDYCQKELKRAFKELKDKGLYLGEWHYHPHGSNKPSGLDIKSLTEIAAQDNYRIDKPIMIIISPLLECALTIHDKKGQCVKLPLEVLD